MSLENFEKAIQISRQMSDKYAEAKLAYDIGLVFSKRTKYYKVPFISVRRTLIVSLT
jgi:hypothetical protein